jgi:16S rRNA processing protein RimM
MPSARQPGPQAEPPRAAGLIRVGRIAGAHGLKGALKFRPDDPASTVLGSVAQISLAADGGEARTYRLKSAARVSRNHLRIVLEEVGDLAGAEALKGATVFIAASDLPALKPGEFYYYQVLGMEVRLTDGRSLGMIEEVISTGANEVWEVRGEMGEVLVPVIEDVVKAIDFDSRVATIEAIPGLLDSR